MKFSISSGDFLKYLGISGSVIPTRSTLPILENFYFVLSGNKLSITATDLEVSITVSLTVKGETDGKAVIPAKRLLDTIRALPNTTVNIMHDSGSNRLELKADSGEYKLTGESVENYPTFPSFKAEGKINIENGIFRRLITKTEFAASKDELRPAMTGVLFQIRKNELKSVSTDGHRLVCIANKSFSTSNPDQDIIIPVKTLSLILKCLEDNESTISFGKTNLLFQSGNVVIQSKLIEEKYPNYESVIPVDNEIKLVVDKNLLLSSVRRTALYASSVTHLVRFSLSKETLIVSAEDIDFGSEAKEKIPCSFDHDSFVIGFNSSYMIDLLTHIDTEEVVFLLSSPSRAVIVKPHSQQSGEDLLMLLMPIRLNV